MRPIGFSHAYKTTGTHSYAESASHIFLFNPNDNQDYKAKLLAKPFGSRRAPPNWGRSATRIQVLALILFDLVTAAYFDYLFSAGDSRVAKSGSCAFGEVAIGVSCPDNRSEGPSAQRADALARG